MVSSLTHRRTVWLTFVLVVALGVGGCSPLFGAAGQSGEDGPSLPGLKGAAQVRDQIARSESAIIVAAGEMAELATACPECADALNAADSAAQQRLALVGGAWDPWPETDPETLKDLPQPASVGEAPLTPDGLSAYMAQTANEQLTFIELTEDIEGEEAAVLAAVLLGRIVSAYRLAQFYGVNIPTAIENLPPGATSTSAGENDIGTEDPQAATEQDAEEDATERPQSEKILKDWATSPAAAEALVKYDCIASTLGFTSLAEINPDVDETLYASLMRRVSLLREIGVPDDRDARCILGTDSSDELFSALLGVDLTLLAESGATTRAQSVAFLKEDLEYWMAVGAPSDTNPGLTHIGTTGD